MTFIAGFHCHDGIVMCADSQEGDGYNKRLVNKISEYFILGQWGVMWGCSGSGPAIKNFSDKLKSLLGKDPYDKSKTERTLETAIKYMHETYPKEGLAMLVALWNMRSRETNLYQVYEHSDCLSPVDEGNFCCTGMDLTLGNTLIDSAFDYLMRVEEAVRLGIFVTAIIKERTDGVGGPTDVSYYSKGEGMSRVYPRDKIDEIEKTFPPTDFYQGILDYWASKNADIRGTISRKNWK